MGMDVYGRQPTMKEGEYFRNNIWWWHGLAAYIETVAPTIAERCASWYTNDGDGLDNADALALADALDTEIASRGAEAFAEVHARYRAEFPGEEGAGIPFTVENLRNFVKFLRSSGGFSIY